MADAVKDVRALMPDGKTWESLRGPPGRDADLRMFTIWRAESVVDQDRDMQKDDWGAPFAIKPGATLTIPEEVINAAPVGATFFVQRLGGEGPAKMVRPIGALALSSPGTSRGSATQRILFNVEGSHATVYKLESGVLLVVATQGVEGEGAVAVNPFAAPEEGHPTT